MFAIVWSYRADQGRLVEFRETYGADGVWSRLFARHPGFIATRLYADTADEAAFITVDMWRSEEDFLEFKQQYNEDYAEMDRRFAGLSVQQYMGSEALSISGVWS